MYRAIVKIKGKSPLSQSRQHRTEYLDGESHEDYENRTWREKSNYDENGMVYVPAMAFKQAMDLAAKRLAIPDPDNKRANMTKFFVSDVCCEDNMSIGIHKDNMPQKWINANVDGVRGSGKRVPRSFPQTPVWEGIATFLITEPKITHEMFERVIRAAGQSIGVGQFRPANGGLNGKWTVVSIEFVPYEFGEEAKIEESPRRTRPNLVA
jgi:hypothetical protein